MGFQGIYFYNNILGGGAPINTIAVSNAGISDYNLWLTPPVNPSGMQPGPPDVVLPYSPVAQQIASAGFVDAGAGDFRIQSGSAAKNIGVLNSPSLPMPLDDIDGVIRGSAVPDLPDAGERMRW